MQIEFHFRQILQVKFYDLSELQSASSTLTKKFKFQQKIWNISLYLIFDKMLFSSKLPKIWLNLKS